MCTDIHIYKNTHAYMNTHTHTEGLTYICYNEIRWNGLPGLSFVTFRVLWANGHR